jgi:hypothetical protein
VWLGGVEDCQQRSLKLLPGATGVAHDFRWLMYWAGGAVGPSLSPDGWCWKSFVVLSGVACVLPVFCFVQGLSRSTTMFSAAEPFTALSSSIR